MGKTLPHGARVLLLEDDALINLAMADLLEEMGFHVSAFMHLREAVAAVERELPDLAILDVNIDGQKSYEVADRLHQRGVPIVFLTGYAMPNPDGKWNDFPHCHKPCAPVELKMTLRKALASERAAAPHAPSSSTQA